MKTKRLGKSGLELSAVTLGMMSYGDPNRGYPGWTIPLDEARPFIQQAHEAGITTFDTANIYSAGNSEEILGKVITELAVPREDVQIATKVHAPVRQSRNGHGLSRVAIMQEIDASLSRLGTDYVDLYQIHGFDPNTPLEETMEALHDVVKAGKARYIGACNLMTWQLALMQSAAEKNGWTKFISIQMHYNLLIRELERELAPYAIATGLGILAWSPLARGRLGRPWNATGSGARQKNDDFANELYGEDGASHQQVVNTLQALAEARGVPMAQVALAWVAQKSPVASPIVGATKGQHIDDALAAVELELTTDEITNLEQANSMRNRGLI